MRIIRLTPDYQCFPLWEASNGEIGNIDPRDLPISEFLRIQINSWADAYDETLDLNDHTKIGFPSKEAESGFRKKGLELAELLKGELGDQYAVIIHLVL